MATYYKISDEDLGNIADAIRELRGEKHPIRPIEFSKKVRDIINNGTTTDNFDAFIEGSSCVVNTNAQEIFGSYFLANNSGITTFNAPMIETLSSSIFCSATALRNVFMPNCTKIIGSYAFSGCSNLLNVSLPKLSYISARSTFHTCGALSVISFPELQRIDECYDTFYSCTNLVSFNAPKLSEIISGDGIFRNCLKLTTFNAPNLFSGCYALEKIIFPKLNKLGGGYMFGWCSNLSQVIFAYGGVVTLTNYPTNIFYYTPMTQSSYLGYYGSIYVPSAYLSSYMTDSYWSYFSSRIATITDDMWAEINAMTAI